MFCPKCGTELKDGDAFCNKCGERLEKQTEKKDDGNFVGALICLFAGIASFAVSLHFYNLIDTANNTITGYVQYADQVDGFTVALWLFVLVGLFFFCLAAHTWHKNRR